MATDNNGNKHGTATLTDTKGNTTGIVVDKEVVNGKVVTKSRAEVGVIR